MQITTADTESARAAARLAGQVAGASEATSDGREVNVRIAAADAALPGFLRLMDRYSITVNRASVRRPSMDDVFLNLTGRWLEESRDATETTTDRPIGATRA